MYTLIFILNYKKKIEDIEIKEYPRVSIIVPAYNEEDNISDTLERLSELNYPKDKLEIIVVDDGSKDNTYNIAKEFERKYNFIKVFRKENGGKASALNYGIKKSTGEYIVTLDADSYPKKDVLIEMIKYFYIDPDVSIVVPSIQTKDVDTIIRKYQYVDYAIYNFSRLVLDQLDSIYIVPGPFSIFKREVFEKIGYFDEKNITEDMEIALRARAHNLKIKYCPNAIVYTITPKTFKSLFKQRVRWYLGFIDNYLNYRNKIKNEFLSEVALGIAILLKIIIPVALVVAVYASIYNFYQHFMFLYVSNFDLYTIYVKSFMLSDFSKFIEDIRFTIIRQFYLFLFTFLMFSMFLLFILIYRRYEKDHKFSNVLLYIFIYLLFSLYLNGIFILSSLYYKIFGSELRWGGITWRNSLINRLRNIT